MTRSLVATVGACIDRGERVDLHWWFDGREVVWRRVKPEPLPPADRIFLVVATAPNGDVTQYVDPAGLLRLPLERAREVLADAAPTDRYTYALRDSLERALRLPSRFGADAYGPLDDVPRAGALPPPEWPDADKPHELTARGPWCSDYGAERGDADVRRALCAQVGVHVDNDNGRATVEPIGPGAGSLEHWKRKLLELEQGPTWLNGVPVRRRFCTPVRFEVGLYELTANVGLGTGGRDRRVEVMTLAEAAERVRAGRYPHFQYSAAAGRWTETG